MSIYLLVKTHKVSGLKYLCQTRKKDYKKYKGSGDYWKKHLKIHGNIIETQLLKICNNKLDLKKWGKHYSNKWNIVDAKDKNGKKIWANLVPETGNGMDSKYGKIFQNRPEVKEKNRQGVLNFWKNNPDARKINSIYSKTHNPMKNSAIRKRHKQIMKQLMSGKKNPAYNSKIFNFVHKSGMTESCTGYNLRKKYNIPKSSTSHLITGYQKIVYGWSIV